MGSSPQATTGVSRAGFAEPVHNLFITPRTEIDALCRFALRRFLANCDPDLAGLVPPAVAAGSLENEQTRGPGHEAWTRLAHDLERLTVLDPACGEGHMLVGMLDLLDHLWEQIDRAIGVQRTSAARRQAIAAMNLYGVEALAERAVRARHLLATAVTASNATPLRDAIRVMHGDSLVERGHFHWNIQFRDIMRDGGFHIVVGNPPFVRHELIADPLHFLRPAAYKRRAYDVVEASLRGRPMTGCGPGPPVALSRRSDLSFLFAVFGLSLLRPGGVLAFVMPRAVLCAQYGESLPGLLRGAEMDCTLVENRSRRSFAQAAVNTVQLLAWRPMRAVPGTQVNVGGSPIGAVLPARSAPPTYLRASPRPGAREIVASRCAPLGSVGHLRYPIKTGLNRFFYPDVETRERFRIERAFLVPVLKSPREVSSLMPKSSDSPTLLFHCPYTTQALRAQGATGALAYIEWGATQVVSRGQDTASHLAWPSVPSLRGRDPWYAVRLPAPADVLCPRFFDRRFFLLLPAGALQADQTFYGLELLPALASRRALVGALLNSSLSYLMLESHGRTGLGDGVRQYALRDMASVPVPCPQAVEKSLIPRLNQALTDLASRPVMSIFDEVVRADRMELDNLVCAGLGFPEAVGAAARLDLVSLVQQRLDRAVSFGG